ncbi:MAG: DUF5009 domain-containing protein [Verrucomicrobiota bacterium]|mgnify:CR=1 FL=1|jgi:predicted acyltransferase|nr:DUF5009 domain-containing protein [Verrucomicrobiota bacterium]
MKTKVAVSERLESLDILRGIDLFLLVFFQPILGDIVHAQPKGSFLYLVWEKLFTHVEWEGLRLWDMVMPLFLFMAGASIPFAFAKYLRGEVSTQKVVWRITRRVVLLFVFGAIVQGNLLDLNLNRFSFYSNTLQSIASGYFFAVLIYLFLGIRGVSVAIFVLPALYTFGMLAYGKGYEPDVNLAMVVDRFLMGRFMPGASINEAGVVEFAGWYQYTWIYSTLNFTTTVLTGLLTGYLLKNGWTALQKFYRLLLLGGFSLLLAWAITFFEPVNKHLWTSSMTFLTSGISIILMATTYYLVDGVKWRFGLMWLKIYGMNSILAYMLYHTLEISSLTRYWLHGLRQYTGDYYPFFTEFAKVMLIFAILRYCYKRSVFLRV